MGLPFSRLLTQCHDPTGQKHVDDVVARPGAASAVFNSPACHGVGIIAQKNRPRMP
jgi:hypothetical protein